MVSVDSEVFIDITVDEDVGEAPSGEVVDKVDVDKVDEDDVNNVGVTSSVINTEDEENNPEVNDDRIDVLVAVISGVP